MIQAPPPIVAATGLRGLVGSGVREATATILHWQDLEVDITDADSVKVAVASSPAVAIVNFAAFTNVGEAWRQRGDRDGACYRTNVVGVRNLAMACAEQGKYLLHVSTDYVYGGEQNRPYTEKDSTGAVEWYGQTKCWGESEVAIHHPHAAIFRIASPFRASWHRSEDIVRKLVRLLGSGTLPPMFEDTIVTPTFIDDFARAVERAIIVKPTGIYNVVGSTAITPAQLAHDISAVYNLDTSGIRTGKLADYLAASDRPYAKYLNLSNEKVRQTLGVAFSTLPSALAEVKQQQTEVV